MEEAPNVSVIVFLTIKLQTIYLQIYKNSIKELNTVGTRIFWVYPQIIIVCFHEPFVFTRNNLTKSNYLAKKFTKL